MDGAMNTSPPSFHDISHFIDITNASLAEAQHCLEKANGDLSDAVLLFLEQSSGSYCHLMVPSDPDELLKFWQSDERWKGTKTPTPPEYATALNCIVIKEEFMRDSTMRHKLRSLDDWAKKYRFPVELNALFRRALPRCSKDHVRSRFPVELNTLFQRAMPGCSNDHVVDIPGVAKGTLNEMRNSSLAFISALGWERHYLLLALKVIVGTEDETGLQIVIALMHRGAHECNSRKRDVFYRIVNRVETSDDYGNSELLPSSNSPGNSCPASQFLCKILFQYIDSIKDKAFKSTFLEPTKMYYNMVGDSTMEGDVDVHGATIYLSLLASSLGIALNRDPFMHEAGAKGIAQFVDASLGTKGLDCWSHENLGKSWEAIPSCRETVSNMSSSGWLPVTRNAFYFAGANSRLPAVAMGRNAAEPDGTLKSARARESFAVYLEQFCSYFSSSFILQRMFTHLTGSESNDRIEKALQNSYEGLRKLEWETKQNTLPNDVKLFCYDVSDDFMTFTFNERNALRLFSHIGVCRNITL